MNGRLIVLMRSIHRDLDAIATIYDKLERYPLTGTGNGKCYRIPQEASRLAS
jgi:hypothetical protein